MRILILARRFRSNQSEADEHDFIYNKLTLKKLKKNSNSISIKYDLMKNYKKYVNLKPNYVIFLGFDPIVLDIRSFFNNSKFAIWAKCYSSSIKEEFKQFYNGLNFIFDSCHLNNLSKNKNYYYLPTAIHKDFNYSFLKKLYLSFFEKKLVNQTKKVDILFSGSPRFNRKDNYRQKLINILIKKNIKVLICAPKKIWKQSEFKIDNDYEKNLFFADHNYWATKTLYENSKFVLDLPWLDTIIPKLEEKFDPQFALGWNVFRSSFNGSNLITYDCEMNRNLGLNENNCNFYKSNIEKITNIGDEIENIIKNTDKTKIEYKKNNLKNLFIKNHTYDQRWSFIIDKLINEQ